MSSAKREVVSRSEVAEWEEPRHPGPASQKQRTPHCPTLQHGTPLWRTTVTQRTAKALVSGHFARRRHGAALHAGVQAAVLHAGLRGGGRVRAVREGIRGPAACAFS